MALNINIEKTRKDIEKKLADTGALNAVVGTADLAVKKVREARTDLTARAAAIDPKALAGQAQATVSGAPEQLKALPTKAQNAFGDAIASALTAYGDLAARGNDLVARVRRQQSTKDLKAQMAATVSHAKGTTTTAKKAAATTATATKTAAKKSTTTAKKSAAQTKTSAKSTTTSAKKTATAAAKATEAAAKKVGD
jgi:type IV secretory pathway TrbL component